MQTTNLKNLLLAAGPQSKLCWVKFTPNGASAPTVDECHGINATVSRSSAGVYVVTLTANATKAMGVVGLSAADSGTNNTKLAWAESVANKTVTVTGTVNAGTHIVGPIQVPDVSSASSTAYGVAPVAGTVTSIYSVLWGAITVADAAITNNINGTPITDGGLTIAYTSSAAGDVDSATPSAANTVAAGDKLTAVSDGGSTDAAALDVYYTIQSQGVASDTIGQITLFVLVRESS